MYSDEYGNWVIEEGDYDYSSGGSDVGTADDPVTFGNGASAGIEQIDPNADSNWYDFGGGWFNEVTGAMEDYNGKSLGNYYLSDGSDLLADPNSTLQLRDGVTDGWELVPPTNINPNTGRVDTQGNSDWFKSVTSAISSFFKGGQFSMSGGSGGSGSQGGSAGGNPQQQMAQSLQQQLAAARLAGASPAVTSSLENQIRNLLGGSSSSIGTTVLLVGGAAALAFAISRRKTA